MTPERTNGAAPAQQTSPPSDLKTNLDSVGDANSTGEESSANLIVVDSVSDSENSSSVMVTHNTTVETQSDARSNADMETAAETSDMSHLADTSNDGALADVSSSSVGEEMLQSSLDAIETPTFIAAKKFTHPLTAGDYTPLSAKTSTSTPKHNQGTSDTDCQEESLDCELETKAQTPEAKNTSHSENLSMNSKKIVGNTTEELQSPARLDNLNDILPANSKMITPIRSPLLATPVKTTTPTLSPLNLSIKSDKEIQHLEEMTSRLSIQSTSTPANVRVTNIREQLLPDGAGTPLDFAQSPIGKVKAGGSPRRRGRLQSQASIPDGNFSGKCQHRDGSRLGKDSECVCTLCTVTPLCD